MRYGNGRVQFTNARKRYSGRFDIRDNKHFPDKKLVVYGFVQPQ